MTAKELIEQLQGFLDERDGEDLEVRLDVDSVTHYSICDITLLDDYDDDGEDAIFLQSMKCVEGIMNYDSRIMCQNVGLN